MIKMKKYSISDICKINSRKFINSKFSSIQYLDTGNITRNRINEIKRMEVSKAPSRAQNQLGPNSIVYSMVRPNLEHFGFFEKPDSDLVVSSGFIILEVKQEFIKSIDPKFLYLLITQKSITKHLSRIAENSVSSYPSITSKDLSSLSFFFPSLDEQKNISNLFFSLEKKIELNLAINRNLEAIARQLYDYWFVQFDFPDESGRPYRTSGGKMVWNNRLKRNIPEHWEVVNIFDSVDVQYGFPFSTDSFVDQDSDVPVVRIRDILNGTVSAYSTEQVGEKYRLSTGDLILGMDGNFHMNLWCDNKSFLNQRCVRFRQKDNSAVSTLQVMYEIAPYIRAKEQVAKGSTVGHLSDKDLKDLWIMTPLNNKYFSASSTLNHISNLIIENRREISELTKLRDDLLPILLNGQVSIRALR